MRAWMASVVSLAACAPDPTPNFGLAKEIEVEQSDCRGNPVGGDRKPALEITSVEGTDVAAVARDVPFRAQQDVCGFAHEVDDTSNVLLQPCNLHPDVVAKSDCFYDFTMSLTSKHADGLALWRREDEFSEPSEATKLADAWLGPRF